MQEIIIHSWDELQSAIFDGVWDASISRYRDNRVYRGMSNSDWHLYPSLNRVCPHDLSLERPMLRSFRKYGYADLSQITSFWQMLAMAQQYGLPTRLLDWSYSPLVAAHFATEDHNAFHQDGVIWSVEVDKLNELLPARLKDELKKERCNIFSMEMLDACLGGGFDIAKELSDTPYAFFFEPASTVNRIANQYSLFSIVSDPTVAINDLAGMGSCFRRIVIPARVKLEIRDKLDYINVSERMIYPGLDGVCKWITRRYMALGPQYNLSDTEEDNE